MTSIDDVAEAVRRRASDPRVVALAVEHADGATQTIRLIEPMDWRCATACAVALMQAGGADRPRMIKGVIDAGGAVELCRFEPRAGEEDA